MKIETNLFFWLLNNEFANILQIVRSFSPLFSNGCLLEAGILLKNVQKMVNFRVKIGGWAFISAWALIRDFTVSDILYTI